MSERTIAFLAVLGALTFIIAISLASEVGIERTKTCRAQPQLCDTHMGPRAEVGGVE